MKVKELDRTVNVAWSPPAHHPILLATGSAAQQVDASFNSSAALDIYGLNLIEPGQDLELKVSVPVQERFHKVGWGGTGPGVIVGGCDNGKIQMHSVSKLLSGEDALLANQDRHSGAVRSLDFNPFQTNLLASGASESEIYIWDLNNTSTPMTPGAKPQPFEDVAWLAWNKQVQHILASTFHTRCIVWDLRKNEPIIKLTDSTSRVRWKVVAWHPDVATQLCLASEDDSNPVVQLWDLRFATSPLKTLQGHTRGVLTLAWCNQDPDLLISSGKDSRILCWNPNANEPNGELVCEIANSQQVIFEVNWCPRNPSLIASCSCDGHTSIYSLTGSQNQVQTTNKIAESFPGMGDLSGSEPPPSQQPSTVDLRKPPKWLRRPVGSSFGFGGKLVSFGPDGVVLKQVRTEENILSRARNLEELMASGHCSELCRGRSDPLWPYLEASFSPDRRMAIRNLLGYDPAVVKKMVGKPVNLRQNDVDGLSDNMANLNQNFVDGATTEFSDNPSNSPFANTQNGVSSFDNLPPVQAPEKKIPPFKISTGNDVNGNICKALLVGNIEEAVEMCIKEKRMADALILAMAAGPETLAKTQLKYFEDSEGYLSYLIEAIVMENWKQLLNNCELSSWKEALAAVLTYSSDEDLPQLCEELGRRLEAAGGPENQINSEICYIASGNMGPLIERRTSDSLSTSAIQDLVELVLVAEQALRKKSPSEGLAQLLGLYAELLASQGDLEAALRFISNINDEDLRELKERLYYALGHKTYQQPQQQTHPQQQQQQPQQQYMRKSSFQGGQMPAKPPTPLTTYQSNYNRPPPSGPPPPSAMTRSTPSPHQPQVPGKKYVVDPSVQGGSGYRGTSNPMYSQGGGVQMFQHQPTFTPPGSNLIPPGSTFAPPQGSSAFAQPGSSSYTAPGSSSYAPHSTSSYPTSAPPSAPSFPNQMKPNVSFAPTVPSSSAPSPVSQQPPPFSSQQPHTKPPASMHISAQSNNPSAPGWNDPPIISGPPRNQPKPEVVHQNPITHPLGAGPPQEFGGPSGQQSYMPHQQNFGPPPQQNFGPPPQQNFGPPPQQNFGPPPSQQNFGPPPQQTFAPPPQQTFAPPPPQQTFAPPPPQQTFAPPPSQQTFAPPPSQQTFAPPPQQTFAPPPPQQTFAPQPPQQTFAPQPPQQSFSPGQSQSSFTTPSQTSFSPQTSFTSSQQSFHQPPKQSFNQQYTSPQSSQGLPHSQRSSSSSIVEEKPPLPEQYAHIQTVLYDLRTRATMAANNPQLKRKLEEVGRKLETLYDALRESRLSMETISGLEKMIELLQQGEYREALDLHKRMVSGTDFSQIASFMPGLRALIQSALQLGVYLQ